MILDNPLTGEPLRALRSFIPGADLSSEHRVDGATEYSGDTSSVATSGAHAPPGPGTNMEFARAVRIFGGVIIGAAAEEISRSFGHFDESDDAYSDNEPIIGSYDGSTRPSSPSLLSESETRAERTPSTRHTSMGSAVGGSDDTGSFFKRPVIGLKRKFVETRVASNERRNVSVARADATPRAPKGRAALRATAEGKGGTRFVSECELPTDKGKFRLRAYRYRANDKCHEPVVMIAGDIRGREGVSVRVHDQCQTSEVSTLG